MRTVKLSPPSHSAATTSTRSASPCGCPSTPPAPCAAPA
eukprot:jgi/Astpho2/8462/gw1.00124.10.1_t